MRDGSGEVSPKDIKPTDLISEADSIDGHASGQFCVPNKPASKGSTLLYDTVVAVYCSIIISLSVLNE